MIPFLKPYINHQELIKSFTLDKHKIEQFETQFSEKFDAKYSIAFPWGRSAIFSLLKGMNIQNQEIILPAYTCIVVAHSIVLSGNIPVFVDITDDGFNMDIEQIGKAITKNTKAIIATNLFGYPMDSDKLKQTIDDNILVIQDCALAVGTKYKNKLVANQGNAAIYSFNVRKPITTIGGGIVTTNDKQIYEKVKNYRDIHFTYPNWIKWITKYIFFLTQYFVFNKPIFSFVDFIATNTSLIDSIVLDSNEADIHLPENYDNFLLSFQAGIGIAQLQKINNIINSKRSIAEYYQNNLKDIKEIILPEIRNGATYSHYCLRVKKKDQFIQYMRKNGVEIGTFFDYCIPYLKTYRKYKNGEFPNSLKCSNEVVDLPNYAKLKRKDQDHIIRTIKNYFECLG